MFSIQTTVSCAQVVLYLVPFLRRCVVVNGSAGGVTLSDLMYPWDFSLKHDLRKVDVPICVDSGSLESAGTDMLSRKHTHFKLGGHWG